MIPAKYRFQGHNSLRYVYANGKAARSTPLTIKAIANDRRKHSRIAVVVSKKVLKSAVGRNRIRRRVYEYMRPIVPTLDRVYDIVVIVTSPEIRTLPHDELSEQMESLLKKAGILNHPSS